MKSSKLIRHSLSAGACVAGVLGLTSLQAGAEPITILNPSFEEVSGNPGSTTPLDWYPEGFASGTRTYGEGSVTIAPDAGATFLQLNNHYGRSETSQSTGFIVKKAGQVVTLTVGVGNYTLPHQVGQNGGMPAESYYGTIRIQVDNEDVASNTEDNSNASTPTAPPGAFGDAMLTYTTTAADVGKQLGIHFDIGPEVSAESEEDPDKKKSKTAYFDNVRLDVKDSPKK